MLSTATVARKFIETRAEWKRLEVEIAAWRADPDHAVAREKVTRAGKAEAATRALAWSLGLDLDMMEQPKRLEASHRVYSEMTIEQVSEANAILAAEGPIEIVPIDLTQFGKEPDDDASGDDNDDTAAKRSPPLLVGICWTCQRTPTLTGRGLSSGRRCSPTRS